MKTWWLGLRNLVRQALRNATLLDQLGEPKVLTTWPIKPVDQGGSKLVALLLFFASPLPQNHHGRASDGSHHSEQ